jgi:hypothetical protein
MSKYKVEIILNTEILDLVDKAAESSNLERAEFITLAVVQTLESLNLLKVEPLLGSPCR